MTRKGNKPDHIVQGMPWAEIISAGIVTVCLFLAFRDAKQRARAERVDRAVEEYEKTIPGYLEQKQRVANYRDSLMNIKER